MTECGALDPDFVAERIPTGLKQHGRLHDDHHGVGVARVGAALPNTLLRECRSCRPRDVAQPSHRLSVSEDKSAERLSVDGLLAARRLAADALAKRVHESGKGGCAREIALVRE